MNLIRKRERAPKKRTNDFDFDEEKLKKKSETPKKQKKKKEEDSEVSFSPVSPIGTEKRNNKRRVYYNKVEFDGVEFEIGDDVDFKRREDSNSYEEDPEMEDCKICFESGSNVMIESDDCLGGFHLNCLKPPLKEVPEGDWICQFCEIRKSGSQNQKLVVPKPPYFFHVFE